MTGLNGKEVTRCLILKKLYRWDCPENDCYGYTNLPRTRGSCRSDNIMANLPLVYQFKDNYTSYDSTNR